MLAPITDGSVNADLVFTQATKGVSTMENTGNLAQATINALLESRGLYNPLPVLKENIPQELKAHPYWAVWRGTPRSNGGFNKIPKDSAGRNLRTNSTDRWMIFDDAIKAYETGGWDGLGILLTVKDELLGVDIDKCSDENTPAFEMAGRIVDTLGTYSEISPSGTGIRCIGLGDKNCISLNGNKKDNLELYIKERFLTITGQSLDDYDQINPDCVDKFISIHREYIEHKMQKGDDANNESISNGLIDSSESGKDFAICCRLAEQGLDRDEIKQQLISTGTNHEKYLRDDYIERTVNNAIEKVAAAGGLKPPVNWRTLPYIDHLIVADQEFKDVDWLIDDWLRKDTFVGQIVGEQQTGKSYLLTTLSYSLSAGRSYGPFVIQKPRKVLYLNVEDPREQVERRCKTVINEMGFTDIEMGLVSANFLLLPWLGKFGTIIDSKGNETEGYRTIEQAIECFKPDLIIGDTKSRLSGVEENSNDAQASLVRLLEKLSVKFNCVVLLVHHPNKSNPYSSRGGGAWESNIRLSINLAKMTEKEGKLFGLGAEEAKSSCYKVTCNDNYGGKAEAYFQKDPQTGFPRPCKQAERVTKLIDDWLLEAVKTYGPVNKRALVQCRRGEDATVAAMLISFPDIPNDKKEAIENSIKRLMENNLIYEDKVRKAIVITAKQPVGTLGDSMKNRMARMIKQDTSKGDCLDTDPEDIIDGYTGTGSKNNTTH